MVQAVRRREPDPGLFARSPLIHDPSGGPFAEVHLPGNFMNGRPFAVFDVASVEAAPDVAIDHVVRQTQMDVVWYILPLVMD